MAETITLVSNLVCRPSKENKIHCEIWRGTTKEKEIDDIDNVWVYRPLNMKMERGKVIISTSDVSNVCHVAYIEPTKGEKLKILDCAP